MHGAVVAMIARRMAASWLLLCCVLATAFVTASLLAAIVGFESQALPQALHRRLAADPASSVTVIGLVGAELARTDTRFIATAVRTTFGTGAGQLDESVWSDPLALPASAGGLSGRQADVAAPDRIRTYAALVSGSWPGVPQPGQPIPAAIPVTLAAALHAKPGTVVTLRDLNTRRPIRLQISAMYRQRDPSSPYWDIGQIWTCGAARQGCVMSRGPIVASPAAFGPGGLTVDQASWVVLPDAARISGGDLGPLAARIDSLGSRLQNTPSLGGLVASTTMPQSLQAAARKLTAAESVLVISGIQLLLVGAVALGLALLLLAGQRDQESAVLGARGAAKWQLAIAALAEAMLVAAVAFGPAPLAGTWLAQQMASGWLLHGSGLRLAGITSGAWVVAAIACGLLVAAMVVPVMWTPSVRMAQLRRSGRARTATAIRAGGDVILLALALVAVWQLRSYSSLSGGKSVDPVLVVAPTLALAAVSLVSLRVLPVAGRLLEQGAALGRRAGTTLASWQVSRRPLGQAGPVLLAVLAVATATLAISQYESWHRAASDDAAFAVGSDVQVDAPVPVLLDQVGSFADAGGVRAATPVVTGTNAAGGAAVAVDARTARAAVILRPEESALPLATLWRRVIPSWPAPGLLLPGRPARLQVTASLSDSGVPGLLAAVTVAVQDRFGTVFRVPAGTLGADGRSHALVAVLSASGQAGYPLRLLGLSLGYPLPAAAARRSPSAPAAASLVIKGISLAGPAQRGFARPLAAGRQLASWHPEAAAPGLGSVPATAGLVPSVGQWRATAAGSAELSFQPGAAPSSLQAPGITTRIAAEVTLTAPIPDRPIPGIATSAFLQASGTAVGGTVPLSFGADSVPVTIVAAVASFPTVTGAGGAVIVDHAAVQDVVASRWDDPVPVTTWWLRTASGTAPGLPAGTVVRDRARETEELLADPLTVVPQQGVLAVALGVAALAALGFAVSVAARLRAGRLEGAVLSALGMSRAAQTGRLCAEELMLAVPAAAAGLAAGLGLAHVLVPVLTPAPASAPPVLVVVPLAWLTWVALAVAAIPVLLATTASVGIGTEPASRLRKAEAP
ncbi:MAG TPA: FtsX-like permease family protein [Streptosporangiaceae bacterium]|nr:FtsX-like permease family protein [Streptosporangiaceae bacterium]